MSATVSDAKLMRLLEVIPKWQGSQVLIAPIEPNLVYAGSSTGSGTPSLMNKHSYLAIHVSIVVHDSTV
ncbi:hypothetical protein RSOLAG1IB_08157 [Rhizoctonia solani AG-1 IB]|uniref:Uncharacterized protein n=1 Tax=Thanatephorus cucumeris (strain AG1-IB / isolate 7/3/14) TaxID=1108050 RepID=A0A0B7FIW5_THACB|nr:hypothetical protein RSOLAG1IB_08157 [Rhizoctonia solani AG-1 IB]